MRNNKLFIDVTGDSIHLAIFNKKTIIDTFVRETNKDMVEHVINDINLIIDKNNIKKEMIKEIYWISSPGLYTGVRVGSLILKAWSTFNKIKVYEINKLLFQANKNCYSLLDAKGDKYFLATIKNNKIKGEIKLISKQDVLKENSIIDRDFDFNNIIHKYKCFKKINIKKYELKYFKDAC